MQGNLFDDDFQVIHFYNGRKILDVYGSFADCQKWLENRKKYIYKVDYKIEQYNYSDWQKLEKTVFDKGDNRARSQILKKE